MPTIRRMLGCAVLLACCAIGLACSSSDGPGAPATTTTGGAGAPATSTVPEGADLQPVERRILALFRVQDPSADTLEDGFDDARIQTTLASDEVVVYVAPAGRTGPGTVRDTIDLGVPVQRVETPAFGLVLRFDCKLKDLGTRSVEVAYASAPATAVENVRRALECS